MTLIITITLITCIFVFAALMTVFSLFEMGFEETSKDSDMRFLFYFKHHFYLNLIFACSISYICWKHYLFNVYDMTMLKFLTIFIITLLLSMLIMGIFIGICIEKFEKNINHKGKCISILICPLLLTIGLIITNPIVIKHENVFWIFMALFITTLIQTFKQIFSKTLIA